MGVLIFKAMPYLMWLFNCLILCNGFNIDIPSFLLHRSPQQSSMFGFSVALYQQKNSTSLLIGAPNFDTDQPGVTNAGAVLNCEANYNGRCTYVPFDRSGDDYYLAYRTESKSNQFFGATVKASKTQDIVVACAPRYTWLTESSKKREPVGNCFVARNELRDFQEFSPCRRDNAWGYHRMGSCQAGFEAAIASDGQRMYIGAPGAYYWQGQVHSQNLEIQNDYFTTGEGPAGYDDQYMGYSVASGDFNGDKVPDVALGVPKGLNYTGKDKSVDSSSEFDSKEFTNRSQLHTFVGFNGATGNDSVNRPGYIFDEATQIGYTRTAREDFFQIPLDQPSYAGFAMAVGEFHSLYLGEEIVISIPRGQDTEGELTGKIALYTHDLQWIQNITGDQLGSYFGYCLCVVDFNGDGRDDIIVGSPMYTDFDDKEMKIEIGRVHVLLQNELSEFYPDVIFTGDVHKGRFGLSLASLGDINLDGYDDIAVGAPYGGSDGRGAVYVYHGFPIGKGEEITENMLKYAQILEASDVGNTFTTFGWSLSGGLDTDNNQYPDLLVGAYESDAAFLFRSRPIINFYDFKLKFLSEGKTIDIKSRNCNIRRGKGFTCLDLEFCLAYNGTNVVNEIELEVTYNLDAKHNSEVRLLFQSNEDRVFTEVIKYYKTVRRCRTLKTFVVPGLTDKLSPITADVSYSLVQPRRSSRTLNPVLNLGQQLKLQDSITIQNNCGKDNICVPDLVLQFTAPDTFVLGKNKMMSVDVRVSNIGEDAFEAVVYVTEPPGLLYNKFIQSQNTTLTLSTKKIDGTNYIKVDIGNPLASNQEVAFTLVFQPSKALIKPEFEFLVTANSTNPEKLSNSQDNFIRKVVKAKIDAELTLFGLSEPEILVYNITQYRVPYRVHETHIGPSLIHKYGLLSKGPSEVDEVDIMILWPSKTLEGKHLLYLMEQPIVTGGVTCDNVADVNPLRYQLVDRDVRSKLLGLSSIQSSEETLSGASEGASASQESSSHYSSSSGSTYSSGESSYKSSSSSYSSSSNASSSSSGSYGNQRGYHHRNKREIDLTEDDWYRLTSDCGATTCTRIHCRAVNLGENKDIYVYLRSRLYMKTITEYKFPVDDVYMTTRMVTRARINAQGVTNDILKVNSKDVRTQLKSAKSLEEAPPIPWWVILLATLAGILILLVIILILWKCGYFKRHRPKNPIGEASQPLNAGSNGYHGRNGHNSTRRPLYPGDEVL